MSLRYLVTKRSHCANVIPLKGWFFTLVKSRGFHGMCACRPILRDANATEETLSLFNDDDDETNTKIKSGNEKRGTRVVAAHESATSYFKPAWYEFIRVVGCMHSSSFIYNNNNTNIVLFSFSRARARSYSYTVCEFSFFRARTSDASFK
jgi:hypothetical protein